VSGDGIYSQSRGLKAKYFSIGFTLEINKSSGNSNYRYGAAKSTGLGQFPSSKFFRQNNICMSPVVGSHCGATVCQKLRQVSVIAQLYPHGKLTTPRCENQKIRHENEIFKANEHAPHGCKLQIYIERHQKTYHKISRDYSFK
jgi:hypothetical protein